MSVMGLIGAIDFTSVPHFTGGGVFFRVSAINCRALNVQTNTSIAKMASEITRTNLLCIHCTY